MLNSVNTLRKPQIAAILPAYQEEKNVVEVLDVLHRTALLDEIILVDDGSPDRTLEVLNCFAETDARTRVIHHESNLGKGQAIFSAWAATSAPYLILLDADLKCLHPQHVVDLISPILAHQVDMTLGLFVGGHFNTDLSHRLTPILTGQRGVRAEILNYVSRDAAAGYGFEVALSIAARQNNFRARHVLIKGVWHIPSENRSERGFLRGAWWKIHMYGEILRAWYIASHQRGPHPEAYPSDLGNP
jgi:glycosyltransferase involved in cell wall biosynthesis